MSLSASDRKTVIATQDMATSDFNISRIKDVQSRFAKSENLLVPGRQYVREGVLTKVCRKGPKKRHFFLFNDILVYGTAIKGNILGQQTILNLSEMGCSSVCHYAPSVDMEFESIWEGLDKDCAFQINHREKSFHVFASSENDKDNWVRNLTTYLSKMKDEKGLVPVFSPVWLPDVTANTCMLCNIEFTIIRRKHHCRECGRLVCSTCSSHEIDLLSHRMETEVPDGKVERACDRCFVLLQSSQRKDKSGSQKKPEFVKPPRPSKPPSVIKKPAPPKPAPYAETKKSKVSTEEQEEKPEGDAESLSSNSDDSDEDQYNSVPPADSKPQEISKTPERQGGNGDEQHFVKKEVAEPEHLYTTLSAKKDKFEGNLIQMKVPVPVPRRTKAESSPELPTKPDDPVDEGDVPLKAPPRKRGTRSSKFKNESKPPPPDVSIEQVESEVPGTAEESTTEIETVSVEADRPATDVKEQPDGEVQNIIEMPNTKDVDAKADEPEVSALVCEQQEEVNEILCRASVTSSSQPQTAGYTGDSASQEVVGTEHEKTLEKDTVETPVAAPQTLSEESKPSPQLQQKKARGRKNKFVS